MSQALNSGLWHGRSQPLGPSSEPWLRYNYASGFVEGKLILDIGCGSGEGASILGERASGVVATDASFIAVRYGKEAFAGGQSNIAFVVASGDHLPFRPGAFDVVTVFETIEHVPDPSLLLSSVNDVLQAGGRLIISTPNKSFSSPNMIRPLTPWHTKEFYVPEFVELLKRTFGIEETIGIVARTRRSRLDSGPFFRVLRFVDRMPESANQAARRLLSSRPGYAVLDFVYGRNDMSALWIERENLDRAYCIVAVCQKRGRGPD